MNEQSDKSKGPGVYVPPPLFYALTFAAAVFIQKKLPLDDSLFRCWATKYVGISLLLISLFFLFRSLRQFFETKNTLILIKPATSLQTTGVYAITRNPMYLGLAILYFAIACFIGNWWNVILFPVLFLIVQEYIIKHEEKYLLAEFGDAFTKYCKATRRWL